MNGKQTIFLHGNLDAMRHTSQLLFVVGCYKTMRQAVSKQVVDVVKCLTIVHIGFPLESEHDQGEYTPSRKCSEATDLVLKQL